MGDPVSLGTSRLFVPPLSHKTWRLVSGLIQDILLEDEGHNSILEQILNPPLMSIKSTFVGFDSFTVCGRTLFFMLRVKAEVEIC